MKYVTITENRVPLIDFVMMNCKCGLCPVQAQSACSKPKIEKVIAMRTLASAKDTEMQARKQMEQMISHPEQMPGPYCSIGVSACKDLDSSKSCICNTCEVYKKYNLTSGSPVEHFCFSGKVT